MNRFILSATFLAVALGLSACDRKIKPRLNPAPGRSVDRGTEVIDDNERPDRTAEKKKREEVVDPEPVKRNDKIPPAPTPNNPEYAAKVKDKPGFVTSPYDGQGRMIDVRGLPPGTEAECPYTHRTFLVPP